MLNDPGLQYVRDDDRDPEMPTLPMGGGGLSASMPAPARELVGPVKPEESDAISTSQASPARAAAQIPMITAEDLEQSQDAKRQNSLMGAIGDNLANRQSFGNFFLGRMNPKDNGPSNLAGQMNSQVDQGIKNKELLQKQALAAPEIDYMRKQIDPDSDISKTSVQLHQALLKKYGVGLGSKNPEMAGIFNNAADSLNGKSAFDVQKVMDGPLGKIMSAEDIATTKNQLMAALTGARLAQGAERINISKDNQTAGAGAKLDSNPLIQSSQRQINQIQIDKHTLQSAKIITPQMVHEIGAGIAAALNQGKSVGLGQMEMQDMATSQTKIAKLEQTLFNKPEDGASPEIKQQMLDTLDRLNDSYAKVQGATAKKLAIGRNYSHNPAAQQALSDKVESYQPQGGQEPAPQPSGNRTLSVQDVQAYAQKHGIDPIEAGKFLRSQGYGIN